jgi:Fe-S cluster biogenesis protein NfuA
MWEQVERVLEEIRPMLQEDGGDCELVDVLDGVVSVRLHGACDTCPSSTATLQRAISRALQEEIPEITSVVRVD